MSEPTREQLRKISVLPMIIDDGSVLLCDSISGGADSTGGEPNRLSLLIRYSDGREHRIRYIREAALESSEAENKRLLAAIVDELRLVDGIISTSVAGGSKQRCAHARRFSLEKIRKAALREEDENE